MRPNWKNLTLHADLLYGSGFYGGSNNADKLPSHCTVNAGTAYTMAATRRVSLTARLDVVDLFDRSYLLHDAGIGATGNQYGGGGGSSAACVATSERVHR